MIQKQSPRPHLGIFVKAPLLGTVKTRLARTIGGAAARTLYADMATDTLQWARKLSNCRKTVFYTPHGALEACRELLSTGRIEPSFQPQELGDLGNRMRAAFSFMFEQGAASAVLIGSDCPLLDGKIVGKALAALKKNDLVLGPASDGGYYLIGLKRPIPELFRLREWSHPEVLRTTIETARKLNLGIEFLQVLNDVDRGEDLAQLGQDLLLAWRNCRNESRDDFPLRVFRRLFWEPGTLIYQLASRSPDPALLCKKARSGNA